MSDERVWPEKAIWHRAELYGQPVCFVQTEEDYRDALAYYGIKAKLTKVFGRSQWCVSNTDPTVAFFMVGVFDGRNSTLVHELAHCCFFLLEHVGVPVKRGQANESFCYLLDHLYDAFAPHLFATEMDKQDESDDEKPADV